jgi:peptidoglycan/xylan/chitin deacetylase (PgdA/CDA1 family)
MKKLKFGRVPTPPADYQLDADGIRRASHSEKKLALLFTADEHVDGAESILRTLQARDLPASFFLTGKALDASEMRGLTRRAIAAGHYVGPHSDGHLLYAPWDDRQKSLVDKPRFQADLYRNLAELRELGAALKEPVYFVPPYEWYNAEQTAWAKELGCQVINFTPGSGSHRDFAPEGHAAFRPTEELIREALDFEVQSEDGLNGHLLLLHLGTTRKDKVYARLGMLIDQLRARGYLFVRVDQLIGADLLLE